MSAVSPCHVESAQKVWGNERDDGRSQIILSSLLIQGFEQDILKSRILLIIILTGNQIVIHILKLIVRLSMMPIAIID
jgi:hypothetical protein